MKKKLTPKNVKNFIVDYAIIIVGCFLYAVSMALFSSPNDIAPGGVIGISILINHLLPMLPIGILSLVLNIPLFIWGGIEIGWKYLSRSLSATVISSIMIDSFELEFIANIVKPYTGNPLLVCIFGGILSGAGMSLIFNRGGSTGGTDIVSRIMHKKKPHVSLGKFMLVCDAFVVSRATRYDIKGKKYIDTPQKYYFSDVGLRNARINFRQIEENHTMENIIFNELIVRDFNVDVGLVCVAGRDSAGKVVRKQLEVDFVCNKGSKRYYVQSAFAIPDRKKMQQESNSLLRIDDSFKKIIVVKDTPRPWYTEDGILVISIYDFLLHENSLDM